MLHELRLFPPSSFSQRLASRGLVRFQRIDGTDLVGLSILPLWRHNTTVAALHTSLRAQIRPLRVPRTIPLGAPATTDDSSDAQSSASWRRKQASASSSAIVPPYVAIPAGALPLCRLSPALLRCVRALSEPLLSHIVNGTCPGHASLVHALALIDQRYMPIAALAHFLLGGNGGGQDNDDDGGDDDDSYHGDDDDDDDDDAGVHRRIGDTRYVPSVRDIMLLPAHARAPWEGATGALEDGDYGGGADAACFSAVAVTLDSDPSAPSSSSSSSSSSGAAQPVQLCTVSSSRVRALQTRGSRYLHNVTERLMRPPAQRRRNAESAGSAEGADPSAASAAGEWATVAIMLDMTSMLRPASREDDKAENGLEEHIGNSKNALTLPRTIGSASSASSLPAVDASPVAAWSRAHAALLAHNSTVWRGVWAAVAEARIAADAAKQTHRGMPATLPTAAESAAKTERARLIAAVPTDPIAQSEFQSAVALLTLCTPAAVDAGCASGSASRHASGSVSGGPTVVCSNEPANCPPPSLLVPPRVLLELAPQFAAVLNASASGSASGSQTEFASALRRVAAQLRAAPQRSWKSVSAVLLTKVSMRIAFAFARFNAACVSLRCMMCVRLVLWCPHALRQTALAVTGCIRANVCVVICH